MADETSSIETKAAQYTKAPNRSYTNALSKIRHRLLELKSTWGPALAAKQHWEDEYNFPPGRHAGQASNREEIYLVILIVRLVV
jgi:hypothetical protein